MAEPTSTPRITAQYLDSFAGQNVMVVGKIVQLRGDSAIMDSAGNITLNLNRESHLVNGSMAEVIGKVNPDHSIKVLTSKDLGPNVDFQLYQNVVDTTHQNKSLFICGSN
ncbi:related to single-stranded DNA binding protein 12k chain [Cephalotrichum gorgonifer]|uniref:Related to single-stranded DNA binding protein 12k chain n=1 Tax=Cephalotrichum gorgonifer TaxID=2041049 RepID=A0AAE8N8K2_9PEZI|nr:related to single-stranded DNA binding protein 12k chain [Cephalotrichum gorgonifer]